MLHKKKILLGITGGIAAYKSIYLLRLFLKANFDVKVVLTPSAKNFVSTLVLNTLSNNECYVNLTENEKWTNHIHLSHWADVFVIAPLTTNTMAKMANGICDNLLLSCFFSVKCSTLIYPSMDEDMWEHPITQQNYQKLKSIGVKVGDVDHGFLASGIIGKGRMKEPDQIFEEIFSFLKTNDIDF